MLVLVILGGIAAIAAVVISRESTSLSSGPSEQFASVSSPGKQAGRTRARGAATALPQPVASGSTGNGGTTLEIVNAAPAGLELDFRAKGRQASYQIRGCRSCATLTTATRRCLSRAQSLSINLAPGWYSIIARSYTDSTVRPLHGIWHLRSGVVYSDCYYTTPVP